MDHYDVPDLSKFKPSGDELATELSREAVEARARQARLEEAALWAKQMHRAFKGVRGGKTRRQRAIQAIEKFGLNV